METSTIDNWEIDKADPKDCDTIKPSSEVFEEMRQKNNENMGKAEIVSRKNNGVSQNDLIKLFLTN